MKTPLLIVSGIVSLAFVPGLKAQTTATVYQVPAGTAGNQDFAGAVGMDFDVAKQVVVTKLGCFDASSDGLNLPIAVRLYDRDTQTVLASADFGPDDPGNPGDEQGTLVGGSRFKPLAAPVTLPVGFHGSIVAEGYGGSELLGNRLPKPWTFNEGNASLVKVGGGRYNFPIVPGAFPETVDGGPEDRYAAGTFEIQTAAPVVPNTPDVTLAGAHQSVILSWPAVTLPVAAAKYQILKSDSPGGVFTQIAEVTTLTHTDSGLTNGTMYCYRLRSVGADGNVGAESAPKCAYPFNLGANQRIAYHVLAGTPGNQNFNGALGMDFDVDNPITVTRLGVFDDNADGLFTTLTARIYNRETEEILAEIVFDPDDPGTPAREDGEPVDGMRFKALPAPLTLPAGLKGLIFCSGYNAMERLRNRFNDDANIAWTLDDGNGSIRFVGGSRYGVDPTVFPNTVDGGPAARYAAGTFQFETTAALVPGIPVIKLSPLIESGAATLVWAPVSVPLPAAKYKVLKASDPAGPFVEIAETTSTTYREANLTNGIAVHYVVVAVASGGQASAQSNVVSATPSALEAGIAYVVPDALVGNQNFGGSLGMHFDVVHPIRVTRLGVFDSGGDGLFLTITAVIYDRQTLTRLATLVFTPEDPGELIGGSRFKTLPTPLVLSGGFQGTMVAYGYGDAELNGNSGSVDLGLTTFSGGAISFVGTSSYGVVATDYPPSADGGPANRYAAGTFAFEPAPAAVDPKLTIQSVGAGVQLNWVAPNGVLERSPTLLPGSWQPMPGATTGIVVPRSGPQEFFRVK